MARRRLSSEILALFMLDYGQKKAGGQRGREPNDRRYDIKMVKLLRRMDPVELDQMLRDAEEDDAV